MKISKVLSQKEIDALPVGFHNVGGVVGLCVRKQKTTSRFVLRYQIDKRTFLFSLPRGLKLKEYRSLASDLRLKLEQGINPKNELTRAKKDLHRELVEEVLTFQRIADEWIDYREQVGYWEKRRKELEITKARLKKYVFPIIGKKKVSEISSQDVVDVLVSVGKSEGMCAKVKTIVNHIFKWSVLKSYRNTNPVEYVSTLIRDIDIQYKQVLNRPALDFHDVPDFVATLIDKGDVGSLLLCFSILTCARSQSVRLMTWDEVNFDKKIWTIPEDHDKVKGATRFRTVMLNDQSIEILNKMRIRKKVGKLVFPNPKTNESFSDNAFIVKLERLHNEKKLIDGIGWVDRKSGRRITQHGFRSSFKTWSVSDELGNNKRFDPKISEYCLLHGKNDPYKGGYERCEFAKSRREMMDEWGLWCWAKVKTKF